MHKRSGVLSCFRVFTLLGEHWKPVKRLLGNESVPRAQGYVAGVLIILDSYRLRNLFSSFRLIM